MPVYEIRFHVLVNDSSFPLFPFNPFDSTDPYHLINLYSLGLPTRIRFGQSIFFDFMNETFTFVGYRPAPPSDLIYYFAADIGHHFLHMVFKAPATLFAREDPRLHFPHRPVSPEVPPPY